MLRLLGVGRLWVLLLLLALVLRLLLLLAGLLRLLQLLARLLLLLLLVLRLLLLLLAVWLTFLLLAGLLAFLLRALMTLAKAERKAAGLLLTPVRLFGLLLYGLLRGSRGSVHLERVALELTAATRRLVLRRIARLDRNAVGEPARPPPLLLRRRPTGAALLLLLVPL